MSLILSLLTPLLSTFLRYYRHAKASYVPYKRLIDPNYVLPLEKLPAEITLIIVSYLDPPSQICLKKACRHFWPNIHVPSRELSPWDRARFRSFIMLDLSVSRFDGMDRPISEALREDGGNEHETHQQRRSRLCSRGACYLDVQLREIEMQQRELNIQLGALERRFGRLTTYTAGRGGTPITRSAS